MQASSVLVKASILLVLSLSFIHAQWGIPFGGFQAQQFANPYTIPPPAAGIGGIPPLGAKQPFTFDQPYALPYGANLGGIYGGYGGVPYGGAGGYGGYGGPGGYGGQPGGGATNDIRLRFAGQVYGYNPFYYVANLVAVDLEYILHYAHALNRAAHQQQQYANNPYFDSIRGMNIQQAQQAHQQQANPAAGGATGATQPATTPATSGAGGQQPSDSNAAADTQKANLEALALVFAKEIQIHITHLVKQQEAYGPKGIGSLTTQLVDATDKLVTAANDKKWSDYQKECSNIGSGLSKITYYGMQQNMPQLQQPSFPTQQQPGGAATDQAGNVKGSSFFPFLTGQGQLTGNLQLSGNIGLQGGQQQQIPQQQAPQFTMPQAPAVPEMPQQFAALQQQIPKQFSFPDMPQMPQVPQMQQVPQVFANQQAQQQAQQQQPKAVY